MTSLRNMCAAAALAALLIAPAQSFAARETSPVQQAAHTAQHGATRASPQAPQTKMAFWRTPGGLCC